MSETAPNIAGVEPNESTGSDPSIPGTLVPRPGAMGPNRESFAEQLRDAATTAESAMIAKQVRRAFFLLVGLWVASIAIDGVAVFGMYHVRWYALALARLIPVAPLAIVAYVALRRSRVSLDQAQKLLIVSDASFALWLSFLSLETGGIDSPYQSTLMFVPLSFAVVPMPWQKGLVRHLIVGVVYVGAMLVGAYELEIGRDEKAPDDTSLFLMHALMNHAMSFSMLVISHTLWSLRREVFTSKNVGRYELRRMLGKGGMGEVWAAYHTTLRREVALKLVRVDDASVNDATTRFEREVLAMTRLTHPNTVRIYDFGAEDGGILYCAMELLDGEDVGATVRRDGPLPFARAHRILLEAASALAEAHSLGIVHRDVKPENLFLMRVPGGREMVKVLDFGIAYVVGQVDDRITHRDAITGTPATVAPEVIEGHAATPAADVYALGCVAYYLLSGTMPFGSKRMAAVLNAHLHELPVPPSVRAGDPIPLALEAIVMRCLAKDPARRFADAGELVAALSTVDFADLSDGPRMSNPPPSSDEDERSPAMKTSDGRARRPSSSGPARLAFDRPEPTPEKP